MTGKRRLIMWTATLVAGGLIALVLVLTRPHTRPLTLSGAVVKQDPDPTKELPLADVEVTALYRDAVIGGGKSDASGAYTVLLRNRLWIGRPVTLHVARQLWLPVPGVRGRLGAVLGTRMPEAAVNKNRDAPRRERDVRSHPRTRQVNPVVLAIPVAPRMQRPAQRKLWLGVLPPVRPHIGRTTGTSRVRVVSHSRQGNAADGLSRARSPAARPTAPQSARPRCAGSR